MTTTSLHAHRAGSSAPTCDNARRQPSVGEQLTTDSRNCAAQTAPGQFAVRTATGSAHDVIGAKIARRGDFAALTDPRGAFGSAIFAELGYAPETIEPGRLHRFATSDRPGDTNGWCTLFDDQRGGAFGCWRQSINKTWCATEQHTMTSEQRAEHARQVMRATIERTAEQSRQWAGNARRIETIWAQCVPVTNDDAVHRYLCRRLAIDTFTAPPRLRLHPALAYWHDGKRIGAYPAMVAPLAAPDGRVVALHQTWVTPDGRKASVPGPAKKLTRTCGPLTGASIRLQQPARGVIGVAEGIETALAASLASGVPTVAAYCANALAGYVWPAGVRRLVIFADADPAGRDAAEKLRARALSARLSVNVMTPTDDGNDWCDVWADRTAPEVAA